MILNIDAIIEDLALFSMALFKMEAIEQELKHLSKKKNRGKRLVGGYSSVLNARIL